MVDDDRVAERLGQLVHTFVDPLVRRIERLESKLENGIFVVVGEIAVSVKVLEDRAKREDRDEERRWDILRIVIQAVVVVLVTLVIGGVVGLMVRGFFVRIAEGASMR